jgi:hypothetical protein
MTFSKIVLWSLLPTVLCAFGTGCSRSQEDTAKWTDRPVPQELLDAEFLRSLSVEVFNPYGRSEAPSQPLDSPSDSPEAKLGRDFLLSLLLDKEAEREPLRPPMAALPVRLWYHDDSLGEHCSFLVLMEPIVDEQVQVYVSVKPGTGSIMVRSFRATKRIVEEFDTLWDACSRQARRQDAILEAAFQVAAQYIKDVRPEWVNSLDLPHEVTDKGDSWIVTFVLPGVQLGGVPVLHVDKRSRKVIKAFHEQ